MFFRKYPESMGKLVINQAFLFPVKGTHGLGNFLLILGSVGQGNGVIGDK